ncbi:MAG: DUF4954 family protein [bacterium]
MNYRSLTRDEIITLERQGCRARSWDTVKVADPFHAEWIHRVRFGGQVRIGVLGEKAQAADGFAAPPGLYDSAIQDCVIGDGVLIANVGLVSSYDIQDGARLLNVGTLEVTGESAFGQGTPIEVVNEAGGRTLPLYDRLTAQIAYMLVFYRYRSRFIERLRALIEQYIQNQRGPRGTIGKNSVIQNCATLRNLRVGSQATLSGCRHLENGTIVSKPEAPTTLGAGVYARDFIAQTGAKIDSSAMLTSCFVGQGVKLERQYSAENSAFFANSEGMHGEACSIFAGPYTVTHHKSTLLIAGLFSFFNAGSGTNQSNHMYKLGPAHQGILERGCKTGSFSYLLWPVHIGAFSVVIGKHYSNFDTSDFPFSYITEEEGRSSLIPAMNLFTVGTIRDSQKWAKRDRRQDPEKLDEIQFDLLNPVVLQKVVRAVEILNELYQKSAKELEFINHNGIAIKRLLLKRCAKYYEMAASIGLGEALVAAWAAAGDGLRFEELKARLGGSGGAQNGRWLDLAGWMAPAARVEEVIHGVEEGRFAEVEEVRQAIQAIARDYAADKWEWCRGGLEKQFDKSWSEFTRDDLVQILTDWKTNKIKLNNMILQDAQKEFDLHARIGFGLDAASEEDKFKDFIAVRGEMETNAFIQDVRRDSQRAVETAARLLEMIETG